MSGRSLNGNPFSEVYDTNHWEKAGSVETQSVHLTLGVKLRSWLRKIFLMSLFSHFPSLVTAGDFDKRGGGVHFDTVTDHFSSQVEN